MLLRLSERIKNLRISQRKTFREVAEGIGVSVSVLQHYEKGRSSPPLENCIRIARYFNISINEFLSIPETYPTGEEVKSLYDKATPEKKKLINIILKEV